jgi:hypothetical protein
MNWKRLTDQELVEVAAWAYRIGMPYLAKTIIKDLEKKNHKPGSSK